MVLKEKLHLPDLSTMMFYFCCFGSHADGGNEEPPDRRQASVDSRQSRSGQGKTLVLFCLSDSFLIHLLYTHSVFLIRLCNLTQFVTIVTIHMATSLPIPTQEALCRVRRRSHWSELQDGCTCRAGGIFAAQTEGQGFTRGLILGLEV